MDFDFLIDTYETERLKTLTVWTQFRDSDLGFRLEPRARTPLEHMVHQCASEDGFMTRMLDLQIDWPVLPAVETRHAFIEHYAEASRRRVNLLRSKDASWFLGEATFFDVARSRAWVLVRRIAHSAHHRGQQTTCLRLLGRALYSTYGPSADTGGLPVHGAAVVYPYPSIEAILAAVDADDHAPLPGAGTRAVTERPAITWTAGTPSGQLVSRASSVLLVDWPSADVPSALLKAGYDVFAFSPNRYSRAELVRERPDASEDVSIVAAGDDVVVFRRLDGAPAAIDLVCAYRPAAELAEILATHVVPLGATSLWIQPPGATSDLRRLAGEAGVTVVEGLDVVEAAQRFGRA